MRVAGFEKEPERRESVSRLPDRESILHKFLPSEQHVEALLFMTVVTSEDWPTNRHNKVA